MKSTSFYIVFLWIILAWSTTQAGDECTLIIRRGESLGDALLYYTFCKTYTSKETKNVYFDRKATTNITTLNQPMQVIDPSQFSAFNRGTHTEELAFIEKICLFASTNQEILLKRLNGESLDATEKTQIASVNVHVPKQGERTFTINIKSHEE